MRYRLTRVAFLFPGIDTDKHKYPIGSGRITFASSRAYSDAIRAAFIEVKSGRICKKVSLFGKSALEGNNYVGFFNSNLANFQ